MLKGKVEANPVHILMSVEKNSLHNIGLSLALAWGKDWLNPIQSRLAQQFPDLTPDELDEINTLCQTAMVFGHQLVQTLARRGSMNINQHAWETEYLQTYPWVNHENLNRLFSQGMYYAMK